MTCVVKVLRRYLITQKPNSMLCERCENLSTCFSFKVTEYWIEHFLSIFLKKIKVLRYIHVYIQISFKFENHFLRNLLLYPHVVELFKLLRLFSEASHYFLEMLNKLQHCIHLRSMCVNYFDVILAIEKIIMIYVYGHNTSSPIYELLLVFLRISIRCLRS